MHSAPTNPDFHKAIATSFQRQTLMSLIGAELGEVQAGDVTITLPFRSDLCQQDGYIHAGVITAIVDSACGYAAKTLMPRESEVLSVEYKINFLRPAKGDRLEAKGRVLKPGKTLTICQGEVFSWDGDKSILIAMMQATMISVPN
jgi:uncharacterized protein (TIGR00369 family)